jgi:hypothetical protein
MDGPLTVSRSAYGLVHHFWSLDCRLLEQSGPVQIQSGPGGLQLSDQTAATLDDGHKLGGCTNPLQAREGAIRVEALSYSVFQNHPHQTNPRPKTAISFVLLMLKT